MQRQQLLATAVVSEQGGGASYLGDVVSRDELRNAYNQFLEKLMRILYDLDAEGIGWSIDAPFDEYHDLATLLVARLSRATTSEEATEEIRKLVPTAELDLIEALLVAKQEFKKD
jgi:hypothetical protein